MLIEFCKDFRVVNLETFDEICIEVNESSTEERFNIIAARYTQNGVIKLLLCSFPNISEALAKSVFNSLFSAWCRNDEKYSIN